MAGGPYADHFQLPCLNVSDDRHMEYARTKLIVPTVCIDRFSWRGSQTNADRFPGITKCCAQAATFTFVHFSGTNPGLPRDVIALGTQGKVQWSEEDI
jgi:hypothetical protein